MKIPSESQCEELMREFGVPENIREHSQQVRRVANLIAEKISEKGVKVNLRLVDRAALMHDVAKIRCIKNKCSHSEEAEKIMREKGFPEVARVVGLHGLDSVNAFDEDTSIEAKIVWYADKRVTRDKIVSLEKRYEYLKEHYGSMSEEKMNQILSTEKNAFALEKEVLGMAGLREDLGGVLG